MRTGCGYIKILNPFCFFGKPFPVMRRLIGTEQVNASKYISILDSIAYIPKGKLKKIRKKSFSLLWFGSRKNEGIALVKWSNLAHPKELGY